MSGMSEGYDMINEVLEQMESQFDSIDFGEAVRNSDAMKVSKIIYYEMKANGIPDFVFNSVNIDFPNDSGMDDEQLTEVGVRIANIFSKTYNEMVDVGIEDVMIRHFCKQFSISLDV